MALLPLLRDERVILLGIGVASVAIVHTMVVLLTMIRDDKEIKPSAPKTQYITQDTEDSLQLETLEKLLSHPNDSVRDVSTKILCDRALNDSETMIHLLWGITREDYEERKNCLRALVFLVEQDKEGNPQALPILHMPEAYTAIVRSLELSLIAAGDRQPRLDKCINDFPQRDAAERFCLTLVLDLVGKFGPQMLIQAKFIEKWLAKLNWGADNAERRRNFGEYAIGRKNTLMELTTRLMTSKQGQRALMQAGLRDSEPSRLRLERRQARRQERRQQRRQERPEDQDPDQPLMPLERDNQPEAQQQQQQQRMWLFGSGDDRVRNLMAAGGVGSRARDHSAEEQRLRRQHREAMVLNDGTRPVGRADIIERGHEL